MGLIVSWTTSAGAFSTYGQVGMGVGSVFAVAVLTYFIMFQDLLGVSSIDTESVQITIYSVVASLFLVFLAIIVFRTVLHFF